MILSMSISMGSALPRPLATEPGTSLASAARTTRDAARALEETLEPIARDEPWAVRLWVKAAGALEEARALAEATATGARTEVAEVTANISVAIGAFRYAMQAMDRKGESSRLTGFYAGQSEPVNRFEHSQTVRVSSLPLRK